MHDSVRAFVRPASGPCSAPWISNRPPGTFAAKDIIDIAGRVTGCGNPDWADSHGPALRPLSP